MTDLEMWLVGTSTAVTDAVKAVTALGRVTQLGELLPMSGTDTGRVRRYVRIHPATTAKATTPTHQQIGADL